MTFEPVTFIGDQIAMPPRQRVAQLPAGVREELDRMLRRTAFGKYAEISEWLRDEGWTIRKSALQAYGSALQASDAAAGGGEPTSRDELLHELGQLRLREHVILRRLLALE